MKKRYLTDNHDLMLECDYEKTKDISSYNLSCSSSKKIWWKCYKGHSYQMTVNAKTRSNYHSCPICNKYKKNFCSRKNNILLFK